MTATPNSAVSSALPLVIPLPSTASILNAIDPSLPPPSPIQQPRTVRLLTHQLMKTIAALADFSPKIRGSFQLHHHHRPPLSLQQPSTPLPSSLTLYLSLWDDNIQTHKLKLFNWRYPAVRSKAIHYLAFHDNPPLDLMNSRYQVSCTAYNTSIVGSSPLTREQSLDNRRGTSDRMAPLSTGIFRRDIQTGKTNRKSSSGNANDSLIS
jgi:hypothetical protein